MTQAPKMYLVLAIGLVFGVLTACGSDGNSPTTMNSSGGGGGTPGAGQTGTATLSWNPVSPPLTGYKVYYGTTSQTYSPSVDVGNTTSTMISLPIGTTYYFALTAYNSGGESGFSQEVSKPIQ